MIVYLAFILIYFYYNLTDLYLSTHPNQASKSPKNNFLFSKPSKLLQLSNQKFLIRIVLVKSNKMIEYLYNDYFFSSQILRTNGRLHSVCVIWSWANHSILIHDSSKTIWGFLWLSQKPQLLLKPNQREYKTFKINPNPPELLKKPTQNEAQIFILHWKNCWNIAKLVV